MFEVKTHHTLLYTLTWDEEDLPAACQIWPHFSSLYILGSARHRHPSTSRSNFLILHERFVYSEFFIRRLRHLKAFKCLWAINCTTQYEPSITESVGGNIDLHILDNLAGCIHFLSGILVFCLISDLNQQTTQIL